MHCKVTVYVRLALFVLLSFSEYACFENLALGRLANQSSIYSTLWGAVKAVDGDKRQEFFSSACAKTDVGKETASWNVDLGKIMSIHHVDIYYRKESDSEYESTYRGFFAGFSLYISNSTNLNNESLCYHRLQNGTNSPPSVMSIRCEMIGRYVTIYNERLPEQTYPDYYSSTAELELCEVEVYGCQGISQYGDYCLTCPSNCADARCNMSTGSCFYCLDGFTGENCTEKRLLSPHSTSGDTIAFYAFMSSILWSPWRGRVLVYDVVKTNIGNGYRSHTGVFLVPKSGVYVFTWTFRTGNNYDHSIQLMKNKEDVGSVYFHSGHGRDEAGGTGIVVTHANAGDDVFTRTNPTLYIETGHYIQSNAHGRSSFAGWKIF